VEAKDITFVHIESRRGVDYHVFEQGLLSIQAVITDLISTEYVSEPVIKTATGADASVLRRTAQYATVVKAVSEYQ
jgi:hypothetical protein